jgi:hypothetical protein|tara:strand:+ start:46998 stop:47861 length:864 start_codon:yes stop_codon:yes gene_type:complete
MFYYYKGDSEKTYEKKYLEGWRKSDIVDFRNDDSPWVIRVDSPYVHFSWVDVEIYPHFLESLAESINRRGLIGGFEFYEKKFVPIDKETSKSFVDFYLKYQSDVDSPLPPEAFGIILTCLSYSPYFLKEIVIWEKSHPTEIVKWTDDKIDVLLNDLSLQFEGIRLKEQTKWNESKDEVLRYYDYHLEKAIKPKDKEKIDRAYSDKLVEITDELEERLIKLDVIYQDLQNKILDNDYHPSFVFKVNGFYVVIARVGSKRLRLRTIYGNIDIPRHTFVSEIELSKILNL